jgi:catalase
MKKSNLSNRFFGSCGGPRRIRERHILHRQKSFERRVPHSAPFYQGSREIYRLLRHPESAKALQLIRSRPVSSRFENSTYNSVNAFRFTNAQGAVVPVRWSMVPVQPFEPVSTTGQGQQEKNFLFDALIASIHRHPLQWRLVITVGQPGDPTNDATVPWPPDRQQVDVGILTIDHLESEDTSPARDINFDPLVLPNGIAPSDDPLLSSRSAAYSQSFTRRESEHKDPSAISPAETGQ